MPWHALADREKATQLRLNIGGVPTKTFIYSVVSAGKSRPYGVVVNQQGDVVDHDALSVITYAVAHDSEEYAPVVIEEWTKCSIWRPLEGSPMGSYGSSSCPINHTHI